MILKNSFFLILTSFLITDCSVSVKNKNDEKDINTARVLAENFYVFEKTRNYDGIASIFDVAIKDDNTLNKIKKKDSVLGDILNVTIDNIETNSTITSSNKIGQYIVFCTIKYRNKPNVFKENLVIKNTNDSLKIVGYNLNQQ